MVPGFGANPVDSSQRLARGPALARHSANAAVAAQTIIAAPGARESAMVSSTESLPERRGTGPA